MLLRGEFGKVRADEIGLGTLLWSRDEFDPDGPLVLKRVVQVFERLAVIWEVRAAGQVFRTTDEHPFAVASRGEGDERGVWVLARDLRAGDLLRTDGGKLVAVESVTETDRWETVYNWEIEEYHTYFVSATADGLSVWAHNACGAKTKERPEVRQAKRDSRRADQEELSSHDWEFYHGHGKEGHHTIPRAIQAKLPPALRNHPDIRGRAGNPNIRMIPTSKHIEIHQGAGGGRYNQRFEQEILKRGGYRKVTVQDILEIRNNLWHEFGLGGGVI
jgi:hypothetical protein